MAINHTPSSVTSTIYFWRVSLQKKSTIFFLTGWQVGHREWKSVVCTAFGEGYITFCSAWSSESSGELENLGEMWWKPWLSVIIKLYIPWLSSPLIIRLFPCLDYHESVILQKTRLKGLILMIKSTYHKVDMFPWKYLEITRLFFLLNYLNLFLPVFLVILTTKNFYSHFFTHFFVILY